MVFSNQVRKIVTFLIIFSIAAIISSVPILLSGFNPLKVYDALISGGFGGTAAVGRTLIKTAPLLLCGLGLLTTFRCGIWNIGAEGQLYMGALGATVVGLSIKGIPGPIHLFILAVASFALAAAWGGIAGFLKVRYHANEMIVTLLMNFIAYWIISYMVRFPLRPASAFNPVTATIAESARLPSILPGTSLHAGILMALFLALLVWFLLQRTILGYRIKAVGSNPEAAAYGGISVNKITMVAMLMSGGLSGLAGMTEVAGVHYLLTENISFNYGYLAISVALLGRLNPFGAILASVFIAGLLTGGRFVEFSLGIPYTLVYVIVAIFILAVLLEGYIENKLAQLF